MKICPNLRCYETQPHLMFSEWNENGKHIDTDIQKGQNNLSLDINTINDKIYDEFIFIPNLDQIDYDVIDITNRYMK